MTVITTVPPVELLCYLYCVLSYLHWRQLRRSADHKRLSRVTEKNVEQEHTHAYFRSIIWSDRAHKSQIIRGRQRAAVRQVQVANYRLGVASGLLALN